MAEAGLKSRARMRAEDVARSSYGRLLALLAAPTNDIAAAEDALGDAFVQALRRWPEAGIPDTPEAWLLTVARNRQADRLRSSERRRSVRVDASDAWSTTDVESIPDRRLALMFVCAHPAIDPGIRTPLMLQTVLGCEAKEIARAYAVPAPAMSQRLVRAKRRIRDARIPFVVPERDGMPGRLPAVLEAVYGAYAIDWQVIAGTQVRQSLSGEALYLATMLADLLDDEPEAAGLAALVCLSAARADARTSADGTFIPLEAQDASKWDVSLIARGEAYLHRAHAFGRPGRFQLEAAIQSAHCARAVTGTTDWEALRTLHEGLVRIAPTMGALVALAATVGKVDGPGAGLQRLDSLDDAVARRFQPALATRAHLLARAGRIDEACAAYAKAISLTTDASMRAWLEEKREALAKAAVAKR